MLCLYILLGSIAGLHRASYGAYKDAPYESFILRRFFRELAIVVVAAILLFILNLGKSEPLLILTLALFSLSYITTEVWKLFIRYKDEKMYRIPVRMHLGGKAVESHLIRLIFALVFLGIIWGVYQIGMILPETISITKKGMIMGFIIGLFEGIGGGYKDGTFEGFRTVTFIRSPILAAVGGFLMALLTNNPLFILLGLLAFERIMIETKKFFKKGYMPGKFIQGEMPYPEWEKRRKIFLIPYTLTLAGFIFLLIIYLLYDI
ncbi:MAG: hypothetical protein PHZ04_01700 [Patescibacteria group bacterium]|nr:hypothetical protein [Patescibacteria group bacterium]MDD5295234.1 hypothetical protein [Patescibacteria group bacterium]MDD5554779.1 hypothetical protein [Patescibacteria group bacterium]